MKKYIFYLIAFLAVSCEDVLDKKNLGAIDDSYVWSDPNMIELNVNSFYANWMPPVKVHGWQCEVAPKGFDTAGIYESYGRGWLVQIPDEKEDILREGEWNTLRLKVQGDRVQTWLNGEEMVDITDARIGAAQGRIALQIHDGGGIKVLWRNFRLTTL